MTVAEYESSLLVGLWKMVLRKAERFYLRSRASITEDDRDILYPLLNEAMNLQEVKNNSACVVALQKTNELSNIQLRSLHITSLVEAMKICDSNRCRKVLAVVLEVLVQSVTVPSKVRDQADRIARLLRG